MMRFSNAQTSFEIGGVTFGGRSGARKAVMIGSLIYPGHTVVEDRLRGRSKPGSVEMAVHRLETAGEETGLPSRYQEHSQLEHLRGTHEDIIGGGMKLISEAYLSDFVERSGREGVRSTTSTPEGRNYVRFLEVLAASGAELVVIGAEGQGKVPETTIGGFAERVLLLARCCDTLIIRRPWSFSAGPIVVGVDGSEQSYLALKRGVELARLHDTWVDAVAVYDPFFHTGVFGSISVALTSEKAGRFNFAAQQKLHDEIIDDGLRSLYLERAKKGADALADKGVRIEVEVLTGKVFPKLCHRAEELGSGLIVVGRHGIHREPISLIGSNAHALVRTTRTNVLVVGDGGSDVRSAERRMPETAPEDRAEAAPAARADPFKTPAGGESEAELVVLKKAKRMAPGFHTHIAQSRIVGQSVTLGDHFMVFDVIETRPSGRVRVTEKTKVEFV